MVRKPFKHVLKNSIKIAACLATPIVAMALAGDGCNNGRCDNLITDPNPIFFIAEYKDLASPTPPAPGWLLCNGQEVSRTTYAALFKVIGTDFGAGDGSTTFNLPNFSNKLAEMLNRGSSLGTVVDANIIFFQFNYPDTVGHISDSAGYQDEIAYPLDPLDPGYSNMDIYYPGDIKATQAAINGISADFDYQGSSMFYKFIYAGAPDADTIRTNIINE